jgi:hypothetical protein
MPTARRCRACMVDAPGLGGGRIAIYPPGYWPSSRSLLYDRPSVMKTVSELIAYIRAHSQDGAIWRQLSHHWSQATLLYCQKVLLAKQEGANGASGVNGTSPKQTSSQEEEYSITFEAFLGVAQELLRKRINVHFKLQVTYTAAQWPCLHGPAAAYIMHSCSTTPPDLSYTAL